MKFFNKNPYGVDITPAYAGKTYLTASQCRACKDHPRVCGKDPNYGGNLDLNKGSPPRMRERPTPGSCTFIIVGITPAYAGKTGSNSAYKDAG